jgi:hypothetical protein
MKITKKESDNREICYNCSKYINTKRDHYIELSTHNRQFSPDDYTYWHFQCWVDFFNQKVEKKMKINLKAMQEQAVKIFKTPAMKNLLSQVEGSTMAMNMLETPIHVDNFEKKIMEQDDLKLIANPKIEEIKDKIKNKINKNGREKRAKKRNKK